MARVLTLTTVIVLVVLSGCNDVDSGKSQIISTRVRSQVDAAEAVKNAGETDVVEQMAADRERYRQSLETLIEYYQQVGNRMRLGWAQSEMAALNSMPQYHYIVEAYMGGPELRAVNSIPLADYMYQEAVSVQKRAGILLVVQDEEMLRTALDKFNLLITQHPTSDKIDDAAYHAGRICEYFKDYTVALLYFKRASQWDPQTPNPAKYRAAYISDQYLMQRDEALVLYQQSIETESLNPTQKDWANMRILELTRSSASLK